MSDETASALEADLSVVADAEQAEGQVQDQTAEAETDEAKAEEEKKTRAQERRERDKAYKQHLRESLAAAEARAAEAEARLRKMALKEPTEAEYPDIADLIAAKAEYRLDKRAASEIEAEAAAAREAAQRIAAANDAIMKQQWTEQAREAESRYADFQQVIAQPGLFPEGSAIVPMILQSPNAADLAYALALDRGTHDALLRMPPIEAARELGRLEARLQAPRPKTTTTAPPPVSPIKGSAPAGKAPSSMSVDEYRAWRAAGGKF